MSTADGVMLSDPVLRMLREAGRPMSTAELADMMPSKHERTGQGDCHRVAS